MALPEDGAKRGCLDLVVPRSFMVSRCLTPGTPGNTLARLASNKRRAWQTIRAPQAELDIG